MLKPYLTLRKESYELLALQNRPFEALPELSLMLPVDYQLKTPFDNLVNIQQGLDELIIKKLPPYIANKAILIPSRYEQLLIHATENLLRMHHQLNEPIFGHCANLLRTEALQIKFIHSKKHSSTIEFKDITESQTNNPSLDGDQFAALQIIAFILLQHRKHNKAGVILKTLHHLRPDETNTRLSLAFTLSELGLPQEAEEILSNLPKNNATQASLLDLLHTKLKLSQNQSKLEDTEHQQNNHSN